MNNQLHEFLIAEKRADLERELEHNRLLHEAENARARRQGFIGNILHALSIWIIRVGERLHERYHVSAHLPGVQE
jgi:hypothetical protein